MKFFTAISLFLLGATTLCAAPENVRVLPGTTTATEAVLYWDKPTDYKQVKQYRITLNGKPVGTTEKNFFKITSLAPSRNYKVVVTAEGGSKPYACKAVRLKTNPAGQSFNVKDFGAKGDGKTLDTKAIQAAIDACTPYGEVIIPRRGICDRSAFHIQGQHLGRLAAGSRPACGA